MYREFINERYADTGHKLRWIRSIETQIKRDWDELNQLCEKVDTEKIDHIEIEELLEKISGVKAGLKNFIENRNKDIEGVLWVDTNQMLIDLQAKEDRIIKILNSLSNQTENSHLR